MGNTNVSINGVSTPLSPNFARRVGGAIQDGEITSTEMNRLRQNISTDDDQAVYDQFVESRQDQSTMSIDMDLAAGPMAPKEVNFPNTVAPAVGEDGEPLPDGRAVDGSGGEQESGEGPSIVWGADVQTTTGGPVGRVGVGVSDDRYAVGLSVNTNSDARLSGTYVGRETNPREERRARGALASVMPPGL